MVRPAFFLPLGAPPVSTWSPRILRCSTHGLDSPAPRPNSIRAKQNPCFERSENALSPLLGLITHPVLDAQRIEQPRVFHRDPTEA
jgi:hypothetical protein